jgi:hypothetical protein
VNKRVKLESKKEMLGYSWEKWENSLVMSENMKVKLASMMDS